MTTCLQCKREIAPGEPRQLRYDDVIDCYHAACFTCVKCGQVIESDFDVRWHNWDKYHPTCFRCVKCGGMINENAGYTPTEEGFWHSACVSGGKRPKPRKILNRSQVAELTAARGTAGSADAEAIELLLADYTGELGTRSDFAESLTELNQRLPRNSKYRRLFDRLYAKWEQIAGPWA
jgi:hypothetical protein